MMEALSALGGQPEFTCLAEVASGHELSSEGRGAAAQQEEKQGRQGSTLRGGRVRALCWKPLRECPRRLGEELRERQPSSG